MIRLVDLLGPDHDYCYLVAADDNLSLQKIKLSGPVYRVIRPRWKNTGLLLSGLRTLWSSLQALWALVRLRPQAILSTGPGVAVPASILSKLLGIKVIYVETGSRIFTLSASGRIMYRVADLFFVQWPELLPLCPKAVYAGRLF
jgi:UDP-N-acetylglucosamine:LPS N-acetylglucosamine transferase